jgi:hypothetical protein
MKLWMLGLLAYACTGCTMMSLERHTVHQSDSAADLRYREVMDNLACIAHDPSTLPAYASIYSGTIFVQDQGQLAETVISPFNRRLALGSVGSNPSLNRQISQNWALDPITSPEKLEAMRAACQWAIGGEEHVNSDSMSLLIRPDQAPPGPNRHFSVADRLSHLSPGWLQVGKLRNVSPHACYKAHCCDTWVWVMPEGMKELADFTLIIQDIARVSINSQTLLHLPPTYTPIQFETADTADNPNSRVKFTLQAVVDPTGQLVTNTPYYKSRVDNLGADSSNIRSAIGAAGIAAPSR